VMIVALLAKDRSVLRGNLASVAPLSLLAWPPSGARKEAPGGQAARAKAESSQSQAWPHALWYGVHQKICRDARPKLLPPRPRPCGGPGAGLRRPGRGSPLQPGGRGAGPRRGPRRGSAPGRRSPRRVPEHARPPAPPLALVAFSQRAPRPRLLTGPLWEGPLLSGAVPTRTRRAMRSSKGSASGTPSSARASRFPRAAMA
jgi:hypothetical protein